MDNKVITVVCPNCGASTTNHHNCDYCGSLLVRYVVKNKLIDDNVFGSGSKEIPGLREELKKNLTYQTIKNENEVVVTTMTDEDGNYLQVIETAHCNFGASISNPFQGHYNKGLSLRITFETNNNDYKFAEKEKLRLNWFKQQDIYFLFTQQNVPQGVYYYIDFGEDVENAAKIISSIVTDEMDGHVMFDTFMAKLGNCNNVKGQIINLTNIKSFIIYIILIIIMFFCIILI